MAQQGSTNTRDQNPNGCRNRFDSKISFQQIFLHDRPENNAVALMKFVDHEMRKHELCKKDAILRCWKFSVESNNTTWVLETDTPELAAKLLYLERMSRNASSPMLRRHGNYNGPMTRFLKCDDFLKHSSGPNALETQEPIQSVDATDRPQQTSVLEMEERHRKTNEDTNENIGTTNELKREAKSENKTKRSLSKQEEAAQDLDMYMQKQALKLLQEVATWKTENNRLRNDFSKLARKYISLKTQCGRAMEENEQLKRNQEMEEGFQETFGTADQPLCLDDEPKVDIELFKAKQAIETAANEKAELQAELLRVSGNLVTTQHELADVQQNWQEQQQQMMNQQKQIVKLNMKLEDKERTLHDEAESLAVQTSEMANKRKQQRELECLLQSQRQLIKDKKKTFRDSQIVEELGFASECKLERKKFRPERLETYDV